VPSFGAVVWLAFVYSIYTLFLGLQKLMRSPAEKVLGYTAAIAGCWLGILIVVVLIVGSATGLR
jgi:hypothetical protein